MDNKKDQILTIKFTEFLAVVGYPVNPAFHPFDIFFPKDDLEKLVELDEMYLRRHLPIGSVHRFAVENLKHVQNEEPVGQPHFGDPCHVNGTSIGFCSL